MSEMSLDDRTPHPDQTPPVAIKIEHLTDILGQAYDADYKVVQLKEFEKANPIGVADMEMTVKGRDAAFLEELRQRFPPIKPEEEAWVQYWKESYDEFKRQNPELECTLYQHALIMRFVTQRSLPPLIKQTGDGKGEAAQ